MNSFRVLDWLRRLASSQRTVLLLLGIALISSLLGASAFRAADFGRSALTTDAPLPVMAEGVVEGAQPELSLRPEVSGILAAIHVQENTEVPAGALLVELRNELQERQVALARAEAEAARIQAQQAEADSRRAQQMLASRAISPQDYEAAHYKKLHAQARLAEAEAKLEVAKTQLAYTQVRAPMAGCVLKHYARLGEAVGPGSSQPLLVVADLSRRHVRAWVEDLDVRRVYYGQYVAVTADGFPGQEFRGQVKQLQSRMSQGGPRSDRPGERQDAYF
ncbi:MAG: efflux RND transporter periplasmic adaptor subunit, partial [Planctomycetia bacterium]|nr:efflux RND transporter periplasmic adaptor subunit [Planctomycetia bacterium]